MVALLTKTGIFLYDIKENANLQSKEGLFGWLFWTKETIKLLKESQFELVVENNTLSNIIEIVDKEQLDLIADILWAK